MNQYEDNWKLARRGAIDQDEIIVEHGWEQHVIIDEDNQLVYRYPRHASAAAKLSDEVSILAALRETSWPIAIPELLDYNGHRAMYRYIPGDVLDHAKLQNLNDSQIDSIGRGLGRFLAVMHACDKSVVQRKAWKQTGSLLDYYKTRIELADPHNPWKAQGSRALQELYKHQTHAESVVVHGDLHGLNMVVAPDGDNLVGIIDLSEVEYGDPHQDFRKLFMTDERLLASALEEYHASGGAALSAELTRDWAYVNEWANLCFFADTPQNGTYQRALEHLKKWNQLG